MSFGISAAAWGMIAAGTVAVGAVASADASRKASNAQKDALNASNAADAAQKAQAETGANAAIIANKKRRRAGQGLMASTDPMAAPMGGSVLGSASDGGTKTIQPVGRSTLGGA